MTTATTNSANWRSSAKKAEGGLHRDLVPFRDLIEAAWENRLAEYAVRFDHPTSGRRIVIPAGEVNLYVTYWVRMVEERPASAPPITQILDAFREAHQRAEAEGRESARRERALIAHRVQPDPRDDRPRRYLFGEGDRVRVRRMARSEKGGSWRTPLAGKRGVVLSLGPFGSFICYWVQVEGVPTPKVLMQEEIEHA